MKMVRIGILLIAAATFGALAPAGMAQSAAGTGISSSNAVSPHPGTTAATAGSCLQASDGEEQSSGTTSSIPSAPIQSPAPRSWEASTNQIKRLRSGARAREPTASELAPTSASRW